MDFFVTNSIRFTSLDETSVFIRKDVLLVRRKIGLLMLAAILALLSYIHVPAAHAANSNVKVSVTKDPVRINGQLIDNAYTKYPFISYSGITYLPLTWDNAIALGIGLGWDAEAGLQVYSTSSSASGTSAGWKKPSFKQDLSASRSLPVSYTADKSTYPISVGATAIDNSQEEYPFLELQGITYMPLTWNIVHDLLKLTIFWDPENGLNVIGGQQQVLGNIVFDDADYLYLSPSIVMADGPGGLVKVKKSFAEKPIWMSKEESQKVREQMNRQRAADPNLGTAAEVDVREDGLYYKGLKLLEKTEIVDPSGVSSKIEFSGTLFQLDSKRSLLAIQKKNVYTTASLLTGYLYMYSEGRATLLNEFPQVPAKVIPNGDGSYWIATDIQSVHGHELLDTLRLAYLNADGELKSMNREWNKLSVKMLGLGSTSPEYGEPGFANPQTKDGQIFVQLTPFVLDRERPMVEAGIYSVDPNRKLTLLSEPIPESAQLYVSSDKQLYTLGESVNTIRNISTRQAAMWYDYEMLETE